MILTGHHPAAKEICEALGLKANKTRSLRFKMRADGPATMICEMYLEVDDARRLVQIFKRFKLVELKDGE